MLRQADIFSPEMPETDLSSISSTTYFHLAFQTAMDGQHVGPYKGPSYLLSAVGFKRGRNKLTLIK